MWFSGTVTMYMYRLQVPLARIEQLEDLMFINVLTSCTVIIHFKRAHVDEFGNKSSEKQMNTVKCAYWNVDDRYECADKFSLLSFNFIWCDMRPVRRLQSYEQILVSHHQPILNKTRYSKLKFHYFGWQSIVCHAKTDAQICTAHEVVCC